jgi:sulfide dehydrogenase cytochrome subunit
MIRLPFAAGLLAVGVSASAWAQTPAPAPAAVAAGPSPSAAAMARNCMTCHGADRAGTHTMASLKAYDAAQLAKAMADFKAGARPATIMTRIAKGYSDEQIKAVSDYLAAVK